MPHLSGDIGRQTRESALKVFQARTHVVLDSFHCIRYGDSAQVSIKIGDFLADFWEATQLVGERNTVKKLGDGVVQRRVRESAVEADALGRCTEALELLQNPPNKCSGLLEAVVELKDPADPLLGNGKNSLMAWLLPLTQDSDCIGGRGWQAAGRQNLLEALDWIRWFTSSDALGNEREETVSSIVQSVTLNDPHSKPHRMLR